MNVLPHKFLRQGLRVIVKQVASGQDTIDVLGESFSIHGHHDVHALASAQITFFAYPHFKPGRQPLDI